MSEQKIQVTGLIITIIITSLLMSLFVFIIKRFGEIDISFVIVLTSMIAHASAISGRKFLKKYLLD
ncbi:hypothetical protein [Shewanella sp. SR44-3]|uniref:hypothetical protein n=1 Tax=Shewanella sp. SR44-3 TaxID=2760936 RepID=UPI0015FC8353|nr:hypothetical protein [Shewanella sp. SR44-3]MBB1268826.1 hypothetical protein [Shewanella sp. SR44-3]